MFKELVWLSVADRLKHNKATLIYKALNNQTPDYTSGLFRSPYPEFAIQLNMAHYLFQDHEPRYIKGNFLAPHHIFGILFLKQSGTLVSCQLLNNLSNDVLVLIVESRYSYSNHGAVLTGIWRFPGHAPQDTAT